MPDFDALPHDFVELTPADGLLIDLRYAGRDNFVGRPVYGGFRRLMLHRLAAEKLRVAVALLARERPDLRLLVWDAFRPNRVQRIFWEVVKGTEVQKFVGDPAIGSIHGFGFAVDLTLAGPDGAQLDMGTAFDDFTPLAEPRLEEEHRARGELTDVQLGNRLVLRHVMSRAGFIPIPIEWWHFDALPPDEVRRCYDLVE